jgi:hypothetical protein
MQAPSRHTSAERAGWPNERCEGRNSKGGAGSGGQRFQVALEVVEVDLARRRAPLQGVGIAADRGGHAQRFHRRRLAFAGLRMEHAAQFEQAYAAGLAGGVAAQRGDQTRQQLRTHHRQFGRQRIGQRHLCTVQAPLLEQFGIDEGES